MFEKKKKASVDTPRMTHSMRVRALTFVVAVLLLFALLGGRLFYVQVLRQDFWQQKAVAQQLGARADA